MKTFRSIFNYLLLLIILAIIGISTYIYFNREEITQQIIQEINNQINVEAEVSEVKFDLWNHWPYSSITLNKLRIRGKNCAIDESFIDVKEFSLLINPLNLIRQNYHVDKIYLKDGFLHIFRSANCNNYDILKKSDSAEDQNIRLSDIELKNIDVTYEDRIINHKYKCLAESSNLNFTGHANEFNLRQKGNWKIHDLKIGIDHYLKDQYTSFNCRLKWSAKNQQFDIVNLDADMMNTKWKAKGQIFLNENESNITINTGSLELKNIASLFDESFNKQLNEYELKADLIMNFEIIGNQAKDKWKGILNLESAGSSFQFNYQNKNYPVSLGPLELEWVFHDLYKWKNSSVDLGNFDGKFQNQNFSASLKIDNLYKPNYDFQIVTEQRFSNISQLLALPLDSGSKGTLGIDFVYMGPFPNENFTNIDKSEISGLISLDGLEFDVLQPALKVDRLNGQLAIQNNLINFGGIKGLTKGSDFEMEGAVRNLIPYIFTDGQTLSLNSTIKSEKINLEEWIQEKENSDDYILTLPENINARLNLNIDHLDLDRFKARNVTGDFLLNNKRIDLNHVRMNVAGGKIDLNINIDASAKNRIDWFTEGKMENVHLDSTFYIFRNFNQEFILQRHLEGQVSADFTGFLVSDEKLNFQDDKLIFSMNTTLKNGRLILFEPLQKISRFVKDDELMNLRFEDMQNEIFIKDKVINIPKMEIISNVRTIKVEGWHTFDNQLEYHFEIPITKKKADKDERFGIIEDDKTGQTKVLLVLEGNSVDYKVRYDNSAVKENIKEGVKKEVKELKNLFKKKEEEEDDVELDEDDFFDFN